MVELPRAARFPTAEAIYAACVEDNDDTERTYLGASVLGDECERKLWLAFRWAFPPERFEGRMLRLFQSGHREEARLIADLKRVGVVFEEVESGKQHAVRFAGGHGGGHLDGIIVSGIVEAPAARHVFEAKTHNTKSFGKLLASGVKAAKPMHYAQMQVYMHLKGIDRAFYAAVEKDTDSLYTERVHLDPVAASALLAKAKRIVFSDQAPAKISEKPDFYLCRFCAYREACHGTVWPRMNCRTCLHASALLSDGAWSCNRHGGKHLSQGDQSAGCGNHLFIPDLIPGRQIDADPERETVTYALRDGGTWTDGVIGDEAH